PCARALPSAPRAPAYCFTDALKRKRRHDAGASMHVFRLRVNAMARRGGDPARKNAGNLRRSRNRWLVRRDPLSNQQILFLLARLERVVEPAWALAAAAPGGTIRRIAILRLHGFRFAPPARTTDDLIEAQSFGFCQRNHFCADARSALLQQLLFTQLRAAHEIAHLRKIQ